MLILALFSPTTYTQITLQPNVFIEFYFWHKNKIFCIYPESWIPQKKAAKIPPLQIIKNMKRLKKFTGQHAYSNYS